MPNRVASGVIKQGARQVTVDAGMHSLVLVYQVECHTPTSQSSARNDFVVRIESRQYGVTTYF